MLKKVAIVVMLSIFGLTNYAQAGKDYSAELERSKKELSELEAKIAVQKDKLRDLTKEFNSLDIALRQDLIACKADMDEKTHIRESKRREAKLKQDYHAKRKPAKAEYDRLKAAHRKCNKKIKNLEKKIARLVDDPEMESYNQKVDDLKKKIEHAKNMLNDGIADIYEKADEQIARITDSANKSKIKNQILSDAKVKELALRKEYKEEKQVIVAQMDKARSDYRKNLAEFRAKKAEEASSEIKEVSGKKSKEKVKTEKTRKSSPSSNFTAARQ